MLQKMKDTTVWKFQLKEFDTTEECNAFLAELAQMELFVKSVDTLYDSFKGCFKYVVFYGRRIK